MRLLIGICLVLSASVAGGVEPRAARHADIKSGTGFFVSPENVLITSAHVVTSCAKIGVFPVDGIERKGHILATNPELDIALVSASGPYLGHHLVDLDTKVRTGDQLYALSYGTSRTDPYHPAYLTGTLKGENTLANGHRVLVVQAPIPAGTSGAALVDPQARLVGTIIGHYTETPDLGVVVPVQSIRAFAMKYGFMLSPGGPRAPTPIDRDATLLNASALVQCTAK